MIPILYEKTETTFTSNGIGRLADCIRCVVTEERNGVYECEFDYPITGKLYSEINEGRIIAVTHDETGDIQPFDIYHRTAPINGIVTFYAHHISYRLNGIVVKPFTASGIANALAGLKTNSLQTNNFTFTTDKTTSGSYTVTLPQSFKALLGGVEGSLLDVFGTGEYKYDKFNVYLYASRGTDTNVEIRYGKNLQDIENDYDYSDSYNGVVPYWYGLNSSDQETLVTLPEWTVLGSGTPYDGRDTVYPLDLSDQFESQPTQAQLRSLAQSSLANATPWLPSQNIVISFVQMWQTEEYASVAPLQRVGLCDTVKVIYPELGIDSLRVKVIKVVYNTLLDRYDEMELGNFLESYATVVTAATERQIQLLEDGLAIVQDKAIQATADAATAHTAALEAQASAEDAIASAATAAESANAAINAADAAQQAADSAIADAATANANAISATTYANAALGQLSEVEKVVDVLTWAAEHGTYALTADTEVVEGKYYFTRSGSGTSADPYVYTVVAEPQSDPSAAGYYELTGVDEAISNYVATHLALTNDGLFVQIDDNACKLQIASTGILLYDSAGVVIAEYGSSIILGDASAQHIEQTSGELGFYQGSTKVAYISGTSLYITQAEITNSMRIGDFIWNVDTNRINLRYAP